MLFYAAVIPEQIVQIAVGNVLFVADNNSIVRRFVCRAAQVGAFFIEKSDSIFRRRTA